MSDRGAIFYRGPSLLTGEPILGLLSGLEGTSQNAKTGPMAQAWILRADRSPMSAVRDGSDEAICGRCALRGDGAYGRACYVTTWLGPENVWKARETYLEPSWPDLQALVEGRSIRLGAYGDPAAIPFEVWRSLLVTAAGHVAYTHQWRTCDQRFRAIAMASVDSVDEMWDARWSGWRTFRVRASTLMPLSQRFNFDRNQLEPIEFVCPASDESGHRTTCARCQLCRGTSSPARSVVITAHGKPGNLKAYGVDITGRFPGRPRRLHLRPATAVGDTIEGLR